MENSYAVSVISSHKPVSADGMGKCPACGSPLYHSAHGEAVVCPYCSATVEADRIMPASKPQYDGATLCDLDYAMKIESPVAALVYLESFFKGYDWETFKRTACTEVAEVSELVRKIRMKLGQKTTKGYHKHS